MRAGFYLVVVLALFCLLVGCGSSTGSSSSQTVGADVIQTYSFTTEGEPTTTFTTLPRPLTGSEWELKQTLGQMAGYDLAPYAGENVALIRYPLTEMYYPDPVTHVDFNGVSFTSVSAGLPLYLWVVATDQTTICSYLSVREESMAFLELLQSGIIASGFYAVNDRHIR